MFELARTWLRQCSDSHGTCRNKKKYNRPARLLSFDENVVRVVRTESFGAMPQYATLSYCWGREPFTKLTASNMNTFCQGIAILDLPEVFRDAIRVARELELSYIWIDALCIIQQGDDDRDWLTESALMTDVYGDSYVNIAATSATNVRETIFSKPTHYSGGFEARITTAKQCRAHSFYHHGVCRDSSINTHLATRAWALQERLLPARTIFFGDTGMYWECRSGAKSEFLPNEVPSTGRSHLARPENKEWDWQDIVAQYSRANLTNPRDRLPALAGVARRQHEATSRHYLAGMWRERLITQLPWMVFGERRKRPVWRAPSWSWMSVDSETQYWERWDVDIFAGNSWHYAEVMDAWTTPSGPDPFGQVSDGLLTLKCSALVCAQFLEEGNGTARLECRNLEFPVSLDVLGDEGPQGCNDVYLLPILGGFSGLRRGRPKRKKNKEEGEEEDHRSQAAKNKDTPNTSSKNMDWEDHLFTRGLVLRACGKDFGSRSRFSRIGSFCFETFPNIFPHGEAEENMHQKFIQVLEVGETEAAGAQGFNEGPSNIDPDTCIYVTIE